MIELALITVVVTSVANLILTLYGHIKKSSCFGIEVETEPLTHK